jgi:membrane protein YqaA with SNARE-associated domain
MLRKLYEWVLDQAEKPYAAWLLFVIALAEASVFPIPPDLLLLPMVAAEPKKAWRLAFICTTGSVLGALVGYGIGAFTMATLGQWIIGTYHLQNAFETFHDEFNKWGVWVIIVKGLTPIPFKLVTIASGVAGLNLMSFVLACAATRGARFFLVAVLMRKFGKEIRAFIEKHLTAVAVALVIVVLIGFWLVLK